MELKRVRLARAGVATLVCAVTLTACSSNDTRAASTAPTTAYNAVQAEWLTDTPLDLSKMFVDGVDTKGLVKIRSDAPTGYYEAGRAFGTCTVLYHAFNAGEDQRVLVEVAVKPGDNEKPGWRNPGTPSTKVDGWVNTHAVECNA